MVIKFKKKQQQDMYNILVEIHDALQVKSTNTSEGCKLTTYEIGWLTAIDELLNRLHINSKCLFP